VLGVQRLPRAVDVCRPVRRLFHHIDYRQEFGARGTHEDAIAGLTAFQSGAPPVDGRGHSLDHSIHNDNCREIRKHATDDDRLHDLISLNHCEDICHTFIIRLTRGCTLQVFCRFSD